MPRCAPLTLGVLLALTLGGCATDKPARPAALEKVAGASVGEMHRIRDTVRALSLCFSAQAEALEAARKKRDPRAIEGAEQELARAHEALEALDDAEGSLAIAVRYVELRGELPVAPADLGRLDHVAERLARAAATLHARTAQALEGKAEDWPLILPEVERDRAILKAYRTDLGITARLAQKPKPSS